MTEASGKPAKLLEVRGLKKWFPVKSGLLQRTVGWLRAVDGIDLDIFRGETMGLVGESGCGKSTAARTISRLYPATAGRIILDNEDITELSAGQLRSVRRKIQVVFQDPFASLDPRLTVERIISEPLRINRLGSAAEQREQVRYWMEQVGLEPRLADRFPHQLSGGQSQRVSIARALAINPMFVVADEPVSALDVSIQAQIINLLQELQVEFHLTYLFIAHDLGVVRHICDRVAVMYLGEIVEIAATEDLFSEPLHPYTQALLSAIPVPDPDIERDRQRIILEADVPSQTNPPSGCRFHTRCPFAVERCALEVPLMRELKPGHSVACHLAS
jgi:oligopeptide/dipeptide ABC transporter ATP-binding protein